MSDIWARVDVAIDTDPLQLRDIVAEVLGRARKAEAALERVREVVNALPELDSLDKNDPGYLFHVGQHDMAVRVRAFLPTAEEATP